MPQAAIRGDKMATIAMIPIGRVTTSNRSILKTERRMSGAGGDDFICGHCGHVMLENFDPSTAEILSINVGFARTAMTFPSLQTTVDSGPPDNPSPL